MKGGALLLLLCASLEAQQASIDGRAIDAATGRPMSGVHIRLFTAHQDRAPLAYGAMSDATGHFSISAMHPGSYSVTAEKTGFVYLRPATPAGNAVLLRPGQHLADFKVRMSARAVLSGRVVDEYGDPVPNVQVLAEPVSKDPPAVLAMMAGRGNTDDRGEFRISGPPGKFRIKALPFVRTFDPPEVRSDGTSAAEYGPTYYPGASGAAQAEIVEAVSGRESTGLEIRLSRHRGLTLGGVVTGVPQGSVASVMLQTLDDAQRIRNVNGRGVGPDGKFSFRNLEPGSYRIAAVSTGAQAMQSPAQELQLDSDLINVDLALSPGAEVAGTLEIVDDARRLVTVEKRTVRLQPEGGVLSYGGAHAAEVHQEGSFHLTRVMPGKLRMRVEPLPDNAYIKTVQLDGVDLPESVLDFSRGARDAKLKITVSLNGGYLAGAVLDKDGTRLENVPAIVMLMANAKDSDPDHQARVTPEGNYSFKGIRPGKYRLAAIAAFGTAPDTASKLFETAAEIEIQPGERIKKDVRVHATEQ